MKKRYFGSLVAAAMLAASAAHASELKLMWYMSATDEEPLIKEMLADYTKQHPDTTFNLQIVPYGDIDSRFAQLAAAGELPDISKTSSMRPFLRPYLMDLSEYLGEDYLDNFIKGWADGARFDGKAIAAPLSVSATGMLINKGAFDKAGVAIPDLETGWTWDEFLEKINEVKDKARIRYPLVYDVSQSRWLTYEFQFGNHIYSEQPPYKVVFDHDSATKVLEKFINMANNDMPPGLWSGSSSDNPKQIFMSGQAVAWMSGNWNVAPLSQQNRIDWIAGPTPYGTVKSSMIGGDYIIGFNTSEHQQEVADFIEWMTTDETAQSQYAKGMMVIPANLNVPPVDYGNEAASKAQDRFKHELAESPTYAATDQANPAMQYVWGPMRNALLQATTNEITAGEAIERIINAANDSLAEQEQ